MTKGRFYGLADTKRKADRGRGSRNEGKSRIWNLLNYCVVTESIATWLMYNICATFIFFSCLAGQRADLNLARAKPLQYWQDTISLRSASNKNLIWISNTFLVIDHNFYFLEKSYILLWGLLKSWLSLALLPPFTVINLFIQILFSEQMCYSFRENQQNDRVLFRSSFFDDFVNLTAPFCQFWHYKTQIDGIV